MSINLKRSLLTGCVILLGWASSALGQHVYGEYEYPFDVSEYHDFQPFAPAPLSEYGDGPKANEGYFFNYDRTYWAITPPDLDEIGTDNPIVIDVPPDPLDPTSGPVATFTNDVDNGWIEAEFAYGHRFEGGYVVDDAGWLISGFEGPSQRQSNELYNVAITFDTLIANQQVLQAGFRLSLENFQMENETTTAGFEINRLYRWKPFHHGGVLEWFFGPRLLAIDDHFNIHSDFGLFFDDLDIDNRVDNNIVGPQIGGRYQRRTGRWTMSTEGRFVAGVNFRSIHLEGQFGDDDLIFQNTFAESEYFRGFKTSFSDVEFSPIGEVRFDLAYQLTKAISLRGGYTGIFTGGIARASNTIEYVLPGMDVKDPGWGENIIINGFNLGIEINR